MACLLISIMVAVLSDKLAAWLLSSIVGFVVTSDKYESCGISVELQCGGRGNIR